MQHSELTDHSKATGQHGTCDDMWPSTNPSVCNVALLCEVVAGALKSASDQIHEQLWLGDQANRPCVRLRFLPSTSAPDPGGLYRPGCFELPPKFLHVFYALLRAPCLHAFTRYLVLHAFTRTEPVSQARRPTCVKVCKSV